MDRKKEFKTYEDVIKEYFPEDWKNRKKVCIHCNQDIPEKQEPADDE